MKKKKQSKKEVWMMGFIAFILVTSILGFVWKGGPPKVEYNEIPFDPEGNGWSTEIDDQKVLFNYHPEEVDYINLSQTITQRLSTVELDTTYDLDDPYAEHIAKVQYTMEIGLSAFNVFIVKGFTTENEFERQVITCEDATPYVPVIYFKKSNQTKVSLKGDCIVAEANRGEDLVKIKDRLLYAIFGVIE